MGRVWVCLMAVVAASSLFIQALRNGAGFSWIHLLTILTVVSLTMAIRAIRQGRIASHRRYMIGTYLGLSGAAIGAALPGRIMGDGLLALFGN